MEILDTYSNGGGAGEGYRRAGHNVTGVDTVDYSQTYPGRFIKYDAVAVIRRHGHKFDFIHASPPCQYYTRGNAPLRDGRNRHPELIDITRDALNETGRPWVIENVADARWALRNPILLCGKMFTLGATDTDGTPLIMYRHRLFEFGGGATIRQPEHPKHTRGTQVAGCYGGARRDKWEAKHIRKGGYVPPDFNVLCNLMGIWHMKTEKQLFEAIPPAYTEWIINNVQF